MVPKYSCCCCSRDWLSAQLDRRVELSGLLCFLKEASMLPERS
jgi:hypothetical protein